jgi:hypothetical protein
VSERVTPQLGRALAFSTDLKPDNGTRTGSPGLNDALVTSTRRGKGLAAKHDYCDTTASYPALME